MERRGYLRRTGATVAGGLLAGCVGSAGDESADGNGRDDPDGGSSTATGTLLTSVTDQPVDIGDFESCVVTIEGIWVNPGSDEDSDTEDGPNEDTESDDDEGSDDQATKEDGDDEPEGDEGDAGDDGSEPNEEPEDTPDDEDEGRRYVEFDEPQEADLVRLQGENTQLIDETELAVGEYRFLQLDVGSVEGTLVEGGDAEIDTPGNAPLQFQQSFEIRAGERTRFVADFAPVSRGQGNRYLLRPVATGTRVLYGDGEYAPEAGDDANGDAPDNESDGAGDRTPDDTGN